ncbi:MAG: hypothetical protein GYA51_12030 [Candidatus Methanofastidiosa archaeon]|nr:hypothetical protein [Candidatus Methanofastidiosa archaeon]
MKSEVIELQTNLLPLELSLTKVKESMFPPCYDGATYSDRYINLKRTLSPVHKNIEKGALVQSFQEWICKKYKEIQDINDAEDQRRIIEELENADPLIYLNNHGIGHVEKVIIKANEVISCMKKEDTLNPYEIFILICAIQIHDIGNYYGRNEHEKNLGKLFEKYANNIIPDAVERRVIERIAMAHGGVFDGNTDTLGLLSLETGLFGIKIRERLLASILRFSDELADDNSRADKIGLKENSIPLYSIIFHRYSEALDSVYIKKDSETKRQNVCLKYFFDSDIAKTIYYRNEKPKFLLDEIYDRTLKMERERRYCMQYARPCLSIDGIRIKIIIAHPKYSFKQDTIEYSLEENGYPTYPLNGSIKSIVSHLPSGEEENNHLSKEWSL